ncbi:MAG: MarR family transcriptional regulator [Alphaproteobacteria bacterium]|nr:MarR family transcriptional regulator [Alphaproteobacteria bacterium]
MTQVLLRTDRAKPAARKAKASTDARQAEKERLKAELEVENTLGWLFHDIHRLLGKDFESRIAGLGLTRTQWRVLVTVERTEGGQTQTELADLTEIEKAPLGKTLDRLEAGGWIIRKDDPNDRRARRVYATAKIDKFFPQLAAAAKGTFARTLQGMRQGEVKDLIAQLQKLKRNLGGAED